MPINVTIIIPTYKRIDSLALLLISLKPEVDKTIEIIVVEQGVSHKSEINHHLKNFQHAKHEFLEEIGTVQAINHALKISKGKIIILLDDDVIVHPGLIAGHTENYKDPQVGSVVGRVLTAGHKLEPKHSHVGKIDMFGNFSDGYSSTIRQYVDTTIGCNCSWRKNALERIGGLDPNFWGIALRFEADISLRLKKAGYSIVFDPVAVVDHMRADSGGTRKSEGRLAWYKNFFSNETYFFLKYRPMILFPIFLLLHLEWIGRCMFGFGREVSMRSFSTPLVGIREGWLLYNTFSKG